MTWGGVGNEVSLSVKWPGLKKLSSFFKLLRIFTFGIEVTADRLLCFSFRDAKGAAITAHQTAGVTRDFQKPWGNGSGRFIQVLHYAAIEDFLEVGYDGGVFFGESKEILGYLLGGFHVATIIAFFPAADTDAFLGVLDYPESPLPAGGAGG